jgi:hypothetical protein
MIQGSGSVSLTNGSGCGSGRPKNIWILRIRIRMWIWISNTERMYGKVGKKAKNMHNKYFNEIDKRIKNQNKMLGKDDVE